MHTVLLIQGVQGMASEISEAMNILVQQSVFYLASESLQKYLDNEALAPVGSGQISSAVIRQNLAGANSMGSVRNCF